MPKFSWGSLGVLETVPFFDSQLAWGDPEHLTLRAARFGRKGVAFRLNYGSFSVLNMLVLTRNRMKNL